MSIFTVSPHLKRCYSKMVIAALEPFFSVSSREVKKSLTLFSSERIQACFGWAKNGSSVGYGAWLKYVKPNGRTVTFSMLLGLIPLSVQATGPKPDLTARRKTTNLTETKNRRSNFHLLLTQPWILLFLCFRCVKLALLFLPIFFLYPVMYHQELLKLMWLKLLLKAFELSGPTFMKFGQWMSTRRDIFSTELCETFATLHRKVRPHAFRHTAHELDRAFGKDWRNQIIFDSPDPEPIGSGCVGQVYKVKVLESALVKEETDQPVDADTLGPFDITPLRSPAAGIPQHLQAPNNKPPPSKLAYVEAALKVLHPGVAGQVSRDLIIMEVGAAALEVIFRDLRWLRLRDSVLEFSLLMNRQLDLRVEAQNLTRFRRNFRNFPSVRFPTPYQPFVRQRVMLESWEEGIPVGSLTRDDVPADLKRELAAVGVDALLKMIFIDNFCHADMHPGNLFVKVTGKDFPNIRPDKMIYEDIGDVVIVGLQKQAAPFQLVIVDAGLTASLSQYDFDSFRGVFAAVVKGDGNLVAEQFLHHAAANACSDRAGFRRELSKLVHVARSKELSLNQIDVGELLSDVFAILVKYQVKLESNFISIMLGIMVLEGLGRSLDPNLDILEKARPLLVRKLIF
ncbi:putative aarF domain-containing protein kinase 2 [Hypsibius exemplaris]|uniref:AarF domain-containing protein kinase 2 n=1 Tax=Hypsibius exemplaris TaxID=2072580 RepID=A0A1W0WW90_HYPEX|nr:putative aarF domain-containing protein kinase 2 [Hypsibius exemplaris]